jgi:hypothetical protein
VHLIRLVKSISIWLHHHNPPLNETSTGGNSENSALCRFPVFAPQFHLQDGYLKLADNEFAELPARKINYFIFARGENRTYQKFRVEGLTEDDFS